MRTLAFVCFVVSTASGCATLTPVNAVTEAPLTAQVVLEKRDRSLFKLEVYNTSNELLVVDRDAITLQSPGRIEQREPGGIASTYVIPPHGHHAVNVKFSLAGLEHGEPVWIKLDHALLRDGQAVYVEPIELRVD